MTFRGWVMRRRSVSESTDDFAAQGVTPQSRAFSEGLRVCARCAEWKTNDEFHDSRTGQFSYCRDCRRSYDRQYYDERGRSARRARQRARIYRARAWMASLKEGVPCRDCGEIFPVWVMHWDHLPGFEKVDQVSSMVQSRTRSVVLEEIKKCELVCANCHVLRTVRRARRP